MTKMVKMKKVLKKGVAALLLTSVMVMGPDRLLWLCNVRRLE